MPGAVEAGLLSPPLPFRLAWAMGAVYDLASQGVFNVVSPTRSRS